LKEKGFKFQLHVAEKAI